MSASPVHPLPPDARLTVCARWVLDILGERCNCRTCDRLAATTPPPVRVVRLAGGGIMGDGYDAITRDEYALSNAAHAADTTAVLIPFLTMPAGTWTIENGDEARIARHNATRARTAARFARLALGAS